MRKKIGFRHCDCKKITIFATDKGAFPQWESVPQHGSQTNTNGIWTMVIYPKIAAISYLNTIPFIYGIKQTLPAEVSLLLTPPAQTIENFKNGNADIALVSSAEVPALRDADIVSDYCIGCCGRVRTVVVVSNSPIEKVRRIWLDSHSRTSVQLVGYLAQHLWKIDPEFMLLDQYAILDTPTAEDAFLLIGDKVFDAEGKFAYAYDLGEEWQRATSLPFTFAVWVARKGLSYEWHDRLEEALTFGIEHTYEAILDSRYADRPYAYEYLTQNIDYLFDAQKHKSLKKFWDYGLKIRPKVNPG